MRRVVRATCCTAILSVTDGTPAAQPFVDDPDAAENTGVDARIEAISLLAMAAAMGTGILVGRRSAESAVAVLRHHLDRIFTTADTSARGAGPTRCAARTHPNRSAGAACS